MINMDQKTLKQIKKETQKEIPKNVKTKVDKDLLNIYTNGDGELTDVSRLDVKKTNYLKIILISSAFLAVFLGGISWLGFFIFSGKGGQKSNSIEIKIKTAEEIAAGQEITYILEYINKEKVTLNNVEISVIYPEGFTFISSEPAPGNQYNNSWQIGSLVKRQQGRIEIKGKLIGEVGDMVNLNVAVSFQPANFNSIFKENFIQTNQITSSILTLSLVGPQNSLPEKKVSYVITYKNTATQDLENVQIIVNYPEGFVYQSAVPMPAAKPKVGQSEFDKKEINNIWYFDKLVSGVEQTLTIEGGYVADDTAEKEFKVQIGFLDEDNNFSLQQEKSVMTTVIKQNLNLSLIINGANSDKAVNFGETLNYSIVYKNLGQEVLEDLVITAKIDSAVLDWETLLDKNLGKVGISEIVWDKNSISALAKLNPLDEGSIDWSIRLKNVDDVDLKNINLATRSSVKAEIGKINQLEAGTTVESKMIINLINTTLELKVEGRYFNDDNIAVGGGPLPPVVGQKTTFRIYWQLANNLHEATGVKVQTKLPAGVNWENKFLVSGGELAYSEKDGTVTWSIPEVSANKTFEEINTWFDVSIIPTKDQAGKLVLLTTETNLLATDAVTKANVVQLERSITSNLEDDPIGGGRGLVIDIE